MSGPFLPRRIFVLLLMVLAAPYFPYISRAVAQGSTIQAQFPYSSSAAVEIDPSTGTANYSIPLRVPPGRGGVAPEFALTYNSSQGSGILGVGWSHTIGYIERSTKQGVPAYDNSDTLQMVLAGSAVELVYDATTSRYYPKVEGGFQRIRRIGNQWEVTDTSGTIYYFGQQAASRIQDPTDANRIFRWALDRIVDVSENEMVLTYTKDGNWLYPDEIRYATNAVANLDHYATIRFELQSTDRSDPQLSYHPGFAVRLQRLIGAVVIEAEGNHYARYDLTYEVSDNTYRSLLTQVDLDQGISMAGVPPVRFTYQTQKGFSPDSNWSIPSGLEFYNEIEVKVSPENTEYYVYHDKGVRQVDINNDGLIDMVRSISNATQLVYVNSGDYSYTNQPVEYPNGAPHLIEHTTPMPLDTGSKMVDINGDGRLDFVQHRENLLVPQGNSRNRRAYLREGSGWSGNESQWYLPVETPLMKKICSLVCFQYYVGTMLVDVDNDGLVDVVRSHNEDDMHVVYRNTGSGWIKDNSWNLPSTLHTDFTDGATLVDLNGDRLPDIFYLKDGESKVFMNEGGGWFEDPLSPWADTILFTDLQDGSTQLSDVNGDGLADMVFTRVVVPHSPNGSIYGKKVIINTGNGWQIDAAYDLGSADFQKKGTRMFDADGDGLTDFMTNIASQSKDLYINHGEAPDLLSQVDNGLGGLRTIEYKPSTVFQQNFMPFARPVVRRMIHTIANTPEAYVTEFEYYDGVYSAAEREFLGFGMVLSKDTEGNAVETLYHTDPIKQGRPIEQRMYDRNDVLFSKTTYEWDVKEIVAGSEFVHLRRTDNYIYDGDLDGRRTAEEYVYLEDAPGIWLLDRTYQLGEVDFQTGNDISGDERAVYQYYTSNLNKWIIGLPRETGVMDAVGSTVRLTELTYDHNTQTTDEPVYGRLTRRREWISAQPGSPSTADTQYEYSTCGNVIRTVDPKLGESFVNYDSAFELFPLSTQNDKQHTVLNTYFGINGEGLVSAEGLRGMWGQLKTSTDPNAQTGQRNYDDLGRVTAQISPLDTVSYPTQTAQIEYLPTYIRHMTSTRKRHGEEGTVDRADFYDALGRKIQTKIVSSEPGRYIVSNQVEYNERGLPVKAYLPYDSTNDLHTIDPINPSAPYVFTEYDALGRVVRVTQPDGVTYSNVEYDDWSTTAYDENGHMQKSFFDAFGRLVRKEVYTGADGRSPHYPAASYVLYTVSEYDYDSEGLLTETRLDADGAAVTTRMGYDLAGRKEWMEDPDMGRWEYRFDANGNLVEQTDALGRTVTFLYDELNRLIRKSFSDGSSDVVYDYDDDVLGGPHDTGRLTSISYATGGASFHYDALGREISSTKTLDVVNYDVQREYDALNNLTDLNYPTGIKLEYDYNDVGQVIGVHQGDPNAFYGDVNDSGSITSIDASLAARIAIGLIVPTEEQKVRADTSANGDVSSIDASQIARYSIGLLSEFEVERHVETFVANVRYNVFGQMTYLLMGNGAQTYYRFDPLNQRLLHKKTFSSSANPLEDNSGWATAGGDIQDLSYTYDRAGNILSITDAVNTATQTFTYDHLNRLKTANNPGRYGLRNYEYDVLGNILEKDGKTYSYNQNCGGGPHAVCETFDPVGNESVIYAYDANGNMVAKQIFILGVAQQLTEFEYDGENRLRRIRKDGMVKAAYEYDGDGGRTRKIVDGVTTEFIGSLYEIGPGGASRHIYLGSQRIATVRGDRFHYYHTDHLGGTNVGTDREGVVREIREYRPFGAIAFSHVNYDDPADQGHFYFTQHYEDPESGLYFMQARYYDPELGRFISADPAMPDSDFSEAFNRYSYVYNSPVNLSDPSGNFPILGAIIGAIIGGISGGIIAHRNDQSIWKGVLSGAVQGGFAGAAFGTPFGSLKNQGYFWELMQSSGAFSLGGLVAGAAGWEQGQNFLNYAAAATAGAYVGTNLLKGIKDWALEDRFRLFRLDGADAQGIRNGDAVHVNGVRTDFAGAIAEAEYHEANVLAFNPTSGPIADIAETALSKITFTSSVSRQLSGHLLDVNAIHLSGFSQGGLIASNTMLNLGFRDVRNAIGSLEINSSPVNQIHAFGSAAIGAGLDINSITYGPGSIYDFTNFLGPNLNPVHFMGGTIGFTVLPIGIANHYPPGYR